MPGALMERHSIPVHVVEYAVEGWGIGELYFGAGKLVYHELPRAGARLHGPDEHPLAERLKAYFGGERVEFGDVELDLEWTTPFQRAVAETLRAVPYGEVVTYGELAALAGHPNAQRAAGTFCAHNRFPLVLPCHRVVAAAGLGSYGSLGISYKRRLLELEGAV
jgi:methylated-DNA-[protein]-cysteine S-methyltransferase